MKTKRVVWYTVVAGTLLLSTLSAPTRAQEDPPKVGGHIIIRTQDGVQEYDLDPSQLPPPGDGVRVFGLKIGPDGQIFTFGGPNGDLNGLNIVGPNGVMIGGPGMGMGNLNIIDPGRSYIQQLIRRHEVRSELFLSSKQCEQLDEMDTDQQKAQQQQMQQMQQALKGLGGDLAGKSPDEIGGLVKERMQKTRDMAQGLTDERDKKLASILTAKQMTRLKELDMQWRGPLAMGVKPVADQAKLTDEQFPKVVDLLKEYRQEINRQFGFGIQKANFTQQKGSDAGPSTSRSGDAPPANLPPPATPAEMQDRMEKAQKEIDKARKSLGDKALKGLPDAQRQQWNALTGRRFEFRPF